jgi:hypothetical protein
MIDEVLKGEPFLNNDYIQQQFAIFKKIIVKKNEIEEPQSGVFRGNLMSHINRSYRPDEEIQKNTLMMQINLDKPIDRELYKITSNEKIKLSPRNIVDRFTGAVSGNSKGRVIKKKRS